MLVKVLRPRHSLCTACSEARRAALPAPEPFQARSERVVDNHREGLKIFAPLVLAAALARVSNH